MALEPIGSRRPRRTRRPGWWSRFASDLARRASDWEISAKRTFPSDGVAIPGGHGEEHRARQSRHEGGVIYPLLDVQFTEQASRIVWGCDWQGFVAVTYQVAVEDSPMRRGAQLGKYWFTRLWFNLDAGVESITSGGWNLRPLSWPDTSAKVTRCALLSCVRTYLSPGTKRKAKEDNKDYFQVPLLLPMHSPSWESIIHRGLRGDALLSLFSTVQFPMKKFPFETTNFIDQKAAWSHFAILWSISAQYARRKRWPKNGLSWKSVSARRRNSKEPVSCRVLRLANAELSEWPISPTTAFWKARIAEHLSSIRVCIDGREVNKRTSLESNFIFPMTNPRDYLYLRDPESPRIEWSGPWNSRGFEIRFVRQWHSGTRAKREYPSKRNSRMKMEWKFSERGNAQPDANFRRSERE
jgi:hypothetical protein